MTNSASSFLTSCRVWVSGTSYTIPSLCTSTLHVKTSNAHSLASSSGSGSAVWSSRTSTTSTAKSTRTSPWIQLLCAGFTGGQFERLLGSIFRNQGYEVELGPGSGDGGVDLRLLQRDPIGDVLTFVQAKRHAPHRKIALQPVQALHGASVADGATRSLFVTTSDYLPSARRFAARKNVQMDLYTSEDVVDWCRQATNGIIRDKSVLVSLLALGG